MRRLLTVLLLAFTATGIALSPAEAHNVLISSDPKDGATLTASPARVTLVFDQPVRQGYAQVGVTGAGGSAWADGAAEIAAERVSVKVKPLAAGGSYVVGYRILSADGHPVTGKIGFSLTTDAGGVASGTADQGTNDGTTETRAQGTNGDAAETAADPDAAEIAADPDAAEAAADPDAAEAAANGGAGMAVVWIVGALLLLAMGTAVALRRARPAQATAMPGTTPDHAPGRTDPAPGTAADPAPGGTAALVPGTADPAPGGTTGTVPGSAAEGTKA
ncbi:copper resistance protein CopC [Nonomuraea deserti]|uniref:Copper resistance protein CopC n=1 Tax=Nonomuraea deserti TaxID=1848322 RepID=A0A4R4VB80_9ACTN|nr:copper resistance CopC family protein [Nonomuraea deserti]TDD00757.1 copper resistance protein CopC [Nonomuraea deserti]